MAIKVVVVDAAPLITLASADSLDYLFHFHAPVIVPDAVFHEATSAGGKLGAAEILDWARTNATQVSVVPTRAFNDEMLLRETNARRLSRDLGERAAIEVIRHSGALDPAEPVVFLSDDKEVGRFIVNDPSSMLLLSTWDFLLLLEEAARIQSADAVRGLALARGRSPPRPDLFGGMPEGAREFLVNIIGRKP